MVRVNQAKLLGPTTAGMCHSSNEVTMYINPTNNAANLDTSFIYNIVKKITSRLLNKLLPMKSKEEYTYAWYWVHCLYNGEGRRYKS